MVVLRTLFWVGAALLHILLPDQLLPPVSAQSPYSEKFDGASLHRTDDSNIWEATEPPLSLLSSSLFGSIHGTAYYFVDIMIGYPEPQRQSLIVDTGSSVTAFACHDCESCGKHIDPPYNRTESESVEPVACSKHSFFTGNAVWQALTGNRNSEKQSHCETCDAERRQCMYRIAYMEGSSLQGHWYEDVVWVGHGMGSNRSTGVQQDDERDSHFFPVPINFGCHTEETHLFVDQDAAGILGLEPWSHYGPTTFIQSLFDRFREPNSIDSDTTDSDVFALCLSEEGGRISFGGPNSRYHITPRDDAQKWIDVMPVGSYTAGLKSIDVEGQSADLYLKHGKSALPALIDSGTTLSYFPFLIYYDIFLYIEEVSKRRMLRSLRMKNNRAGRRSLNPQSEDTWSAGTSYVEDVSVRRLSASSGYQRERRELEEFMVDARKSGEKTTNVDANGADGGAEHAARLFKLMGELELLDEEIEKTIIINRSWGQDTNGAGSENDATSSTADDDEDDSRRELGARTRYRGPSSSSSHSIPHRPHHVSTESSDIPKSAAHRLTKAVKLTDHHAEECWRFTNGDEDLEYFPIIKLYFKKWRNNTDHNTEGETVAVDWHPKSYLYHKGTTSFRCLGIVPEQLVGEAVLGASFFIGHDIIFDIGNMRIDIADADCPSLAMEHRPTPFTPYERSTYEVLFRATRENETMGPGVQQQDEFENDLPEDAERRFSRARIPIARATISSPRGVGDSDDDNNNEAEESFATGSRCYGVQVSTFVALSFALLA